MGRTGEHPFKVKKKKLGKENKSNSYSDDYRLTPDLLPRDPTSYCDSTCFVGQSICPEGEVCCSRETCLFPKRRFHRSPANPVSPRRRNTHEEPVCNGHDRAHQQRREGRQKKVWQEDIFKDRGRYLDSRKEEEPSVFECSSCDSCDFCGGHSLTSSLETTDASFLLQPRRNAGYEKYPKSRSPMFEGRRAPRGRGGSCAGDLFRFHEDEVLRCRNAIEDRDERRGARRAKSFTEVYSFLESPTRNYVETQSRQYKDDIRQPRPRNRNEKQRSDNMLQSQSPARSNARTSDSGVGRSCRTSRGSFPESYKLNSSKITERGFDEARCHRMYRRNREDSSDQKQANLLNKMMNQTREHRKQIKTLENELERLRTSGELLTSCEVNYKDVEWRPGDVLGEGSFSTVYKGFYCGTEVAVKELKFKLSQDDKNYFRSEAALLQQLHHPRVVLLMGVCTSSARPFMLLEFLSGGTLYSFIHQKPKGRLDHAAYFSIAKDIAQGVNYLHKHDPQVLHLDLKSMNVLLDSYTRVKIADFGFSILRRSRNGGGGESIVQKGSIRGTPAWMAPELLTRGHVSPKCDVYSFAIILWEMLTASHPFHGLDIYQIMETVEEGIRLPFPQTGVSRELKELITSCWAQNPALRPSFEEILGALETASLPVSWRKVLTRANISPSLLSDVTAARAIIDMMERSAEIVEKRNLEFRKRSKSNEKEINEKEKYRVRNSRKNEHFDKHQDSSIMVSSYKEKSLSPKVPKYRVASPSRKTRLETQNSSPKRRHIYEHEKPTEERHREQRAQHYNKKHVSNDEPTKSEVVRSRRNREEHKSNETRSSSRSRKTEVDERMVTKGQANKKYWRKDERELKEKNDRGKRCHSPSKSKRNEERSTSMTEESYFTDKNPYRKERQRSHLDSSEQEYPRQKRVDLSDSSVELESYLTCPQNHKKREKNQHQRKPTNLSPERKPRNRSPHKNPHCKKTSLNVDNELSGKTNASHFQKNAGIVLTAEQLLSQKQRLRPVHPTGLKDLSLLPQNSLNNISMILEQAINQRRDALGKIQSTKASVPSKDYGWSDWD